MLWVFNTVKHTISRTKSVVTHISLARPFVPMRPVYYSQTQAAKVELSLCERKILTEPSLPGYKSGI